LPIDDLAMATTANAERLFEFKVRGLLVDGQPRISSIERRT
jgi:hypothetical protein